MVGLPVGQVQCTPGLAGGMSMGSTGPPGQEAGVGFWASPRWGGWAASGSQTPGVRLILGHPGAQAPGFSRKLPGGGQCPGWEAWLGWGTDRPGRPLFLCLSVALCPLCPAAIQPTAAARPPHGAWVGMGWGQDGLISTQGPLPRSCPPPAQQEFPLLPPGRPGSIW